MKVLVKIVLGIACLSSMAQASHEVPISAEQMQKMGISVAKIEPANSVVTDALPGQAVIPPRQERVVSAPLAGLLSELHVGVGDSVKKGDVLARIESPSIIGLQREWLQASTAKQLATTQLNRDRRLFKEGIIAERRLLETQSAHTRAVSTLEERRQALMLSGMSAQAIAALESTRQLSSALSVHAQIDGVVLEAFAVVGERVEQAAPLLRLAQLEPLWLELRVPVNRLQGIEPGAMVKIPCEQAKAHVDLIGHNVDPASQTVLVRAEVFGANGCLRPGQYAEARLQLTSQETLYRIPTSAVVRAGEKTVVFSQAAYGFLAISVEVVGTEDSHSIVKGKLGQAESVAVSGLAVIKGAWMGLGGDAE